MPELSISLAGLAILWNIGLTAVVWLRKPGEDASVAVQQLGTELNKALAGHAARLSEIETHMEHMPSSEELAKLEGMVLEINARTEAQSEQLRTVSAALTRIETYLLHNR
jgi:hypothetical protein